jgi:hypothetical protein
MFSAETPFSLRRTLGRRRPIRQPFGEGSVESRWALLRYESRLAVEGRESKIRTTGIGSVVKAPNAFERWWVEQGQGIKIKL